MKAVINKIIGAAALLSVAGFASVAVAEEGPALLVTPGNDNVRLEVLSQTGVTGLQFDLSFRGVDISGLSTEGCLGGLAASHTGGCSAVDANTLRVVVFSPSNADLPTGVLGNVRIPGVGSADVEVRNVMYGDASGNQIRGDAFVDGVKGSPVREGQDQR